MRSLLLGCLVLLSCTHSQSQLAETPSAQARARPAEAPPASTSDKDRERLVQGFDDMETTQRAHQEAEQKPKPAPQPIPQAGAGSGSDAPKKVGPAIQAPPGSKP